MCNFVKDEYAAFISEGVCGQDFRYLPPSLFSRDPVIMHFAYKILNPDVFLFKKIAEITSVKYASNSLFYKPFISAICFE